jgi:hypothetical protein
MSRAIADCFASELEETAECAIQTSKKNLLWVKSVHLLN